MPALIDLAGQRFSKWNVLSRVSNGKTGGARWLCRCDCGREAIVHGVNLRNGSSHQCMNCSVITHGQCGTPLYRVWGDMIWRCENPNHKQYKNYGGRGIKVYSGWRKDFAVFLKWALNNGYKEGLTIDRIDNGGDYRPNNCQFITRSENSLKAWRVDGSHGEKYLTEL